MRIAVAQSNSIIGDLRGNLSRLLMAAANAKEEGADLLVTPELALCGYPPRDLLDDPTFVKDCLEALAALLRQAPLPLLVGAVVGADANPLQAGGRISNGALLLSQGQVLACHRKILLPNYDIFDESRYFNAGETATAMPFLDSCLGISICEDIWNDAAYWEAAPRHHGPGRRYLRDPVQESVAAGADLLINLSASPTHQHKGLHRLEMLQGIARRHRRPLLYVNQVGGNDALVFDGRSLALDAQGQTTLRLPAYKEALCVAQFQGGQLDGSLAAEPASWQEDVTEALCLGIRDYLRKCGFDKVVLGLSGGIDSALVATLAVRALGAHRVIGVAMPSRYSSAGSVQDAHALAKNLGMRCDDVPIESLFVGFNTSLATPFVGLKADSTEENLQARIRGTLLMAYANKFNALLLSTGNKSEVAVGYCTLYGDMCGGLSPISDLYKTAVYSLSHYLNGQSAVPPIPSSTLSKPPSAELAPGQTDQDSLPSYDVLDAILASHIEGRQGLTQLVAAGFERATVVQVLGLVQRSEYKRRQMAPGLRMSEKAFGEGRRLPVAQRYSPA
jgi:NAD+ synthase (glutamine-hydrolysing)